MNKRMGEISRDFQDGFVEGGRGMFQEFLRTGKVSLRSFEGLFIETMTRLIYDRYLQQGFRNLGKSIFDAIVGGFSGGGFSGIVAGDSADSATGAIIHGRRAAGGPVMAGGTYLVDERGPELLHMGGNGSITPNGKVGATIAPVYNISVDSRSDRNDVVRAISESVKRGNQALIEMLHAQGFI